MAFSFVPCEEQTYLQRGTECSENNLFYKTWSWRWSPSNVDKELLDCITLVSTCMVPYTLRANHCLLPHHLVYGRMYYLHQTLWQINFWPLGPYLTYNKSLTWLVSLDWGTWNPLIKNLGKKHRHIPKIRVIWLCSGLQWARLTLLDKILYGISCNISLPYCPLQLLLATACFCFGPSEVKWHHLNATIHWQTVHKKFYTDLRPGLTVFLSNVGIGDDAADHRYIV